MQPQPTQTIQLPSLHPRQLEVARHPARFKVLVCGRRWGKTRLGVVLALAALVEGGRVWWVAPTYAQASIAWRLAVPMARQIPGAVVREADRVIRLGAGELWMKSADQPQNLRGEGLDLLVMDEADFVDEAVWTEALRPTLADRKGRALFISSPNVEGGWFHRLYLDGAAKSDTIASWAFPSWTNPHLDPAEIEAAKRDTPSIVFRREYGAEFVSAGGARIQRAWLRVQEPPPALDVVMGVDLAISTKASADWTAAAVLGRDPDGALYVLDVQRVRVPFHQVLQFVQSMAATWKPRVVAIESVAYQAAAVQELLRKTTLNVQAVHPDKDKLTRFQPLEARYEQGLVRHAPGLSTDFERELLAFPVGDHDDMVDALSTAWSALATSQAVSLDDFAPIGPTRGNFRVVFGEDDLARPTDDEDEGDAWGRRRE